MSTLQDKIDAAIESGNLSEFQRIFSKLKKNNELQIGLPIIQKSIEHGQFDILKCCFETYGAYITDSSEEMFKELLGFLKEHVKKELSEIVDFVYNFDRIIVYLEKLSSNFNVLELKDAILKYSSDEELIRRSKSTSEIAKKSENVVDEEESFDFSEMTTETFKKADKFKIS